MTEKAREDRCRRVARRYDMRLHKSRSTGRYMLVDIWTNMVVYGGGDLYYDLDAIEDCLVECAGEGKATVN
jgi:hypothetical protein